MKETFAQYLVRTSKENKDYGVERFTDDNSGIQEIIKWIKEPNKKKL